MGDSSQLGPDDVVAFVDTSEQDVAEVNEPNAVVDFLEADGSCWSALERKSSRVFRRIVPALVTRLTRKWPGYSTGGSVPG